MATKHVTDATFGTDVLSASRPVLVDFWAEWCGPCRQIGPALEELAEEMADQLSIHKMNIEEESVIPQKFNIRTIPTLILFKDGKEAARFNRAAPKSHLKSWLEGELGDAATKAA